MPRRKQGRQLFQQQADDEVGHFFPKNTLCYWLLRIKRLHMDTEEKFTFLQPLPTKEKNGIPAFYIPFPTHHLRAFCIRWQKKVSGLWMWETTPENSSPILKETNLVTELTQSKESSSSGIFFSPPFEWFSDTAHKKDKRLPIKS